MPHSVQPGHYAGCCRHLDVDVSLERVASQYLYLFISSNSVDVDISFPVGVNHEFALTSPGLHSISVEQPVGEACSWLSVAAIKSMSSAKRRMYIGLPPREMEG